MNKKQNIIDISTYDAWRDYTESEIIATKIKMYDLSNEMVVKMYKGAKKKLVPRAYFRGLERHHGYEPFVPADYPSMSSREKSLLRKISNNIGIPYPIMIFDEKSGKYEMLDGFTRSGIVDGGGGRVKAIYLEPEYVKKFLEDIKKLNRKRPGP